MGGVGGVGGFERNSRRMRPITKIHLVYSGYGDSSRRALRSMLLFVRFYAACCCSRDSHHYCSFQLQPDFNELLRPCHLLRVLPPQTIQQHDTPPLQVHNNQAPVVWSMERGEYLLAAAHGHSLPPASGVDTLDHIHYVYLVRHKSRVWRKLFPWSVASWKARAFPPPSFPPLSHSSQTSLNCVPPIPPMGVLITSGYTFLPYFLGSTQIAKPYKAEKFAPLHITF